jgi:fatty-acyl-CoA synthase
VLHTLNIRLFPEQLAYIVDHAEDRIIFVDDSLVGLLAPLVDRFESVEHFVVIGDGPADGLPAEKVLRYEELIDAHDGPMEWPELDDRQAAGLCYTSGTTGNPKGVLYSHRSTVLHSVVAALADGLDVRSSDVVLPVVPMFHAMAWGLPYICGMLGADLVLPGRFLQAEPLAAMIEREQVTYAGAVPTIWMDLLRHADQTGADLSSLRLVPCGGAAVPRSLMEPFEQRHGVRILQAWGMTETSPLGAAAHPPKGSEGEERWAYRLCAGKAAPLIEARLVDDLGNEVAHDGQATGELEVRGPWIAAGYFRDPEGSAEKFDDGWLRTGDIASIDSEGYIRITDRAKDVIKSGGEWISSVELESELMAHPAILEAAVVAIPDERWTERPLACVVKDPDVDVSIDELRAHLAERVARWWLPEAYAFIDEVPKTSVGKFDKKILRARLEEGALTFERVGVIAEKA